MEATQHICQRYGKGLERRPVIVAMTAGAMEGDRDICLQTGMDDYISKPMKVETLQRLLERWGKIVIKTKSSTAQDQQVADVLTPKSPPLDLAVVSGVANINWEMLQSIRQEMQVEGEPDVVTELIDMFLEDTTEQLTVIKKAIDNFETEALRLAAHAVKGSSQNLGVVGMSEISASLEQKAKLGLIVEAEALLIPLEHEFVRVKSALENFRV